MTVSHADRMAFRSAALLAALAVAFFSAVGSAQAQSTQPSTPGPMRLAPPQRLEPQRPQIPDAPASETPAVEGVGPGVQVDSLGRVDPDSVGTLTVAEGGFGETLWQDTSRRLVDDLLPQLPTQVNSATLRDLERRLLLSAAPPPAGEDSGMRLIVVRVGLLASMGAVEDAVALLEAAPERNGNADLVRLETDLHFLANDNARACAMTAATIREDDAPYWQKALSFCQVLAGDADKASLGVSLLRELGENDPMFFALFDALLAKGSGRTIDSMADASPLHLAMARAAGVQLPADVVANDRPAVLRAVATMPNASVDLRLDAAERAERSGALSAETLRQIYAALEFTEEQLANPLSQAEAESGPVSRALLYRTAVVQTVPTAQAEAVAQALELGRTGGRYASVARVFLPILQKIPASADLIWFAPAAIRALLITGEYELAEAWFRVLRTSAMFNAETQTAAILLRPIMRLGGLVDPADWQRDSLRDWFRLAGGTADGRDHAGLMLAMFDAVGETAPAGMWEELLEGSMRVTAPVPQPALWFQLRDAASERRIGETILLSLITLGNGGVSGSDPLTLRDVIARLRAIGLEYEARALAIEAVITAGL